VDNAWVNVGEKCIHLARMKTLWNRDGLVAWKETTMKTYEHHSPKWYAGGCEADKYWCILITQTVVNILDVRPVTLSRIHRDGESVFELSKKISVEGNYVVRPFERGLFAFDNGKPRKCVGRWWRFDEYCSELGSTFKLKIFDMEEVSETNSFSHIKANMSWLRFISDVMDAHRNTSLLNPICTTLIARS
jgi:hypothetical protein